ncbi:hypothetical protein DL769_005441 [Monosporascus sp. CRB-8-3]|nr:hypothetical protein DL769_005441 [Monosporascus sp. CRB-8-3]
MSPRSQASTNYTSRAIALPTQFRCVVGGEWKPASEFSQTQLKKWSQKKKHGNDGITAANIGLTCKVHTGGPQSTQVKCQGPCGIRKHREAFSKSQRNRPDAWCKQCTDWRERHSGDVPPGAAPNGDMSQDELYMRLSSIDDALQHGRGEEDDEDDEDVYVAREDRASFFHDLDEDDNGDDDGDDDDEDEDDDVDNALAGRFQSVTRSLFRATVAGDDETDDDDEDDARDYVLGNSIVGTQPRQLIGSLDVGSMENLSDRGAAPSSKALGLPTGIGPSYSATASGIGMNTVTATVTASRQNVPAGAASSTVSGHNQDMAPLPPHLRALNAGRSTTTSTTASAAPYLRGLNGSQSTAASSATGEARIRPELRGMTDPSPASNMSRRTKEPLSSATSLDSRAGIESFASYTHVTTEDVSVRPSRLHDYNAFSPRGEMYVKTTGGASVTGKKPPMTSTGRPIRVGPSGWLKGDNRKRFDAAPVFASMPEEQAGGYDSSGSEDEIQIIQGAGLKVGYRYVLVMLACVLPFIIVSNVPVWFPFLVPFPTSSASAPGFEGPNHVDNAIMTKEIRQHNRNGQPARAPDVTPEDPGAAPPTTRGEVGCQAPRASPDTCPQVHETHGNSQTMTSVAPPEMPRQTGVVESFQKAGTAPDSSPRCPSPQSTSAPGPVPSPAGPTLPSPSTNSSQAVVATATATRSSPPRKPGVHFSDRRTFAKRPAITSRRTSSGTSDSTRGELEYLFDESGQATARSVRFLRGLAKHIIDEFAPKGSLVVTPEKLAAFYTRYRLETEVFPFAELFGSRARDAPERIADIFFGLGCAYHLTPRPDQPGSRPRVPGLTPAGCGRYLAASLLAYPDEEFHRLERIAAGGDGPGGAGVAGLLPRPLIRCLLPARPDPGARRIFAAAFEDLARHLPKPPPSSPTVDRCGSPPVAPSPSSSSSSSSSPTTSTAATAVAGPEKRGSTAATAGTAATARSNSWRYVPGALRAIHDHSAVSHIGGAPDPQRAAPGRYRLARSPGGSQTTSDGPSAAADEHGHGEDYFDGHYGQRSPPHHHHRYPTSPVDLHHPPSRPARSMSYQLPAPGPGPGAAGASRSYSYSVSYVPPTTGMSTTDPAPASSSATSTSASTAPPLPPPPVGPFAYGSTMTRQQRSHIVQAARPPEGTHGVAAPVVSLPAPAASPYLPAAVVPRQQNRDREREGERETRRLPSSSSAHHHLHHGGAGGGGAERRASMGAERTTTTTAQRRSDRHGMEMVEEGDHDGGGGGGRGPTWDEVLRAQREGAGGDGRKGW